MFPSEKLAVTSSVEIKEVWQGGGDRNYSLAATLVGVGVGVTGALALSRLLSAQLFGVSPADGVTFITVPIVLCCAALVATYVPARRAMRVDPMVALRYE